MKIKKITLAVTAGLEVISVVFLVIAFITRLRFEAYNMFIALIAIYLPMITTMFPIISEIEEKKAQRHVFRIKAEEYDKGIDKKLENELTELNRAGKTVESIQIVEATGYDDHRKEIFIIYH